MTGVSVSFSLRLRLTSKLPWDLTLLQAIQYYSVDIYAQVGINGQDTLKYQAINNILALLAQASCVLFIDKVGRRWALIGGNAINAVMFLIATILIAKFGTTSSSAGWGFIVSIHCACLLVFSAEKKQEHTDYHILDDFIVSDKMHPPFTEIKV